MHVRRPPTSGIKELLLGLFISTRSPRLPKTVKATNVSVENEICIFALGYINLVFFFFTGLNIPWNSFHGIRAKITQL